MAFERTQTLVRRALLLEYFTGSWNVLEGIIGIAAGVIASSIALIGFGLDSFIEVISAVVLIWRFRRSFLNEADEEAAERKALHVVGITFLLLAVYVTVEAARKLFFQDQPNESPVGIALTAVSLIVMPGLAYFKRETALQLNSRALLADAKETLACTYLSGTVLAGLAANALFGWWWADPIAGLAIVYWLVREGWEALGEARGEGHEGVDDDD